MKFKFLKSLSFASVILMSNYQVYAQQSNSCKFSEDDRKKSRIEKWKDKKILESFTVNNGFVNSENFASKKIMMLYFLPFLGYSLAAPLASDGKAPWKVTLWMQNNSYLKKAKFTVSNNNYEFPLTIMPEIKKCGNVEYSGYKRYECTVWNKSEFLLSSDALTDILALGNSGVLDVKLVGGDGLAGNCGIPMYTKEFDLLRIAANY